MSICDNCTLRISNVKETENWSWKDLIWKLICHVNLFFQHLVQCFTYCSSFKKFSDEYVSQAKVLIHGIQGRRAFSSAEARGVYFNSVKRGVISKCWGHRVCGGVKFLLELGKSGNNFPHPRRRKIHPITYLKPKYLSGFPLINY